MIDVSQWTKTMTSLRDVVTSSKGVRVCARACVHLVIQLVAVTRRQLIPLPATSTQQQQQQPVRHASRWCGVIIDSSSTNKASALPNAKRINSNRADWSAHAFCLDNSNYCRLCYSGCFDRHARHHLLISSVEAIYTRQKSYLWRQSSLQLYTVIHNYGNPYKKWNIYVARPHLWPQLGMVKPEIMLCETVLNLSTLNTLTYLLTSSCMH